MIVPKTSVCAVKSLCLIAVMTLVHVYTLIVVMFLLISFFHNYYRAGEVLNDAVPRREAF